MKKQILFIILSVMLFGSYTLYAQDLIVKRNGDEIKAKVLEISVTEIKYKNFDNINGPLYTILKRDVLFIRYENGTKEIISADNESPARASAETSSATEEVEKVEAPPKVIAFWGLEYFGAGFITATGQRFWKISEDNKLFLGLMIRGSAFGRTLLIYDPFLGIEERYTENIAYVPLASRYYFTDRFYSQADLGPQFVYYSSSIFDNPPPADFRLGAGVSVGYTGPKGWDWSLKYSGIGGIGFGIGYGGKIR